MIFLYKTSRGKEEEGGNELLVKNRVMIFFGMLFFLLVIIHLQLVIHDPSLTYDDLLIIGPLFKLGSWSEYLTMIKTGQILDLQPVRDLSYLIDIKIKHHIFSAYSFHATNLLLWFGIVGFFYRIQMNFSLNTQKTYPVVMIVTAFFALSPVAISTVAWSAARKHLLATLFIFICTEEITKIEKNSQYSIRYTKVLGFYLLSVLSQPINILWPIWSSGYLYFKRKTTTPQLPLVLLWILMVGILGANAYYFGVYYNQIGYGKFLDLTFFETLSRGFLSLGRYFQLVLYPFSALPSPHSDQSPLNIIGLFLLLFALLCGYFKTKNKKAEYLHLWLMFSYFIFHLLVVLYKSNIFCSDTYLLNASLGVLLLVSYVLQKKPQLVWMLAIYVGFFIPYDFHYIEVYKNTKVLWNYSFVKEPAPESLLAVATGMLDDGKVNEAYLFTKNELDSDYVRLMHIYSRAIYLKKDLSSLQKIRELNLVKAPHPTKSLLLALLYLENNNRELFSRELLNALYFENYFQLWGFRHGRAIAFHKMLCSRVVLNLKNECLQKVEASIRYYVLFPRGALEQIDQSFKAVNPANLYSEFMQ